MAPAFGATDARTLAAVADLAAKYGDGVLRISPSRAFVVAGVATPLPLADEAVKLGLIVDPADPLLSVTACVGFPGCARASTDTRADARVAAQARPAGRIHVSGCRKGCAHPGPAAITLVGEAGRYALVRNGCASDPPDITGLTLAEALAMAR